MDTNHIYTEIMMDKYFNEMKYLRNNWKMSSEENNYTLSPLFDIGGDNYRQYKFIMNRYSGLIYEMIDEVIMNLLDEYGIDVTYYDLLCEKSQKYYLTKKELCPAYTDLGSPKNILAFRRKDKYQNILYIFRKFGLGDNIAEITLDAIKKEEKLDYHCYITYSDESPYSNIINSNDIPPAYKNLFSLKDFFISFFGEKEYDNFLGFANKFKDNVIKYFGFTVVRTLKPNTINDFKQIVRNELETYNFSTIIDSSRISSTQKQIMDHNFFTTKNYEMLLGTAEFAESFITAEWLYYSLSHVGKIDLTSISMCYYKAIEQLLFKFIALHTHEKDGNNRDIFVGYKKPNANAQGYDILSDDLINRPNRNKNLTMASLARFLGEYDPKSNSYNKKNTDLLDSKINNQTYEYIIDVLSDIVIRRNDCFHREILRNWNKVEIAKKDAYLAFYLLFGAYTISEAEKRDLGVVSVDHHDDFYNLCAYINEKAYERFDYFPIFYINEVKNLNDFWFAYQDNYLEYGNYGEPVYSGVYFRRPENKEPDRIFNKNDQPKEIWEGVLYIRVSDSVHFIPTGAQKKIYCNGHFFANHSF